MKNNLLLLVLMSLFFAAKAQISLITIPVGTIDLCSANSTLITAEPDGATSYNWFRAGCTLQPVATGRTFVAESGDWYCVATWPDGQQSTTAPVRVRALTAYNNVVISSNSNPSCSSSGVTLTAGPALCSPVNFWDSYQWTSMSIDIPGATSRTYNPSSSGQYSCRVSNSCGNIEIFGFPVTIVSPLTTTVVSINAACGSLSVPNVSTNAYQWLKSNVAISGATTYQYTIPAGQSGSYSCRISNACNTITTAAVTASGVSALTVTAGSSLSFCQGGSVVLTASYSPSNYSFQWKNNGTAILGATGQSYTATNSGSYTVTASSASCTFTSSATVVTVNPIPIVSFSGLSSTYTTISPASTLTGSPAGGVFSGPGISGNTFNPATAGIGGPYTITYNYTSSAGCSASQSQSTTVTAGYNCSVPQSVTVTNITGTTARINWTGSSAPQFKVRYRKSGSSTYSYKTFTWVSGTNYYVLTGLKRNTNYQASIQALCTGGNSTYSTAVSFRTTSATTRMAAPENQISENQIESWVIYPNPAQTYLSVENVSIRDKQLIPYEVYDITGRLQQNGFLGDGMVHVSSLSNGIYLLKLILADKTETIRFIKE